MVKRPITLRHHLRTYVVAPEIPVNHHLLELEIITTLQRLV
jgi:hypothetical protein